MKEQPEMPKTPARIDIVIIIGLIFLDKPPYKYHN